MGQVEDLKGVIEKQRKLLLSLQSKVSQLKTDSALPTPRRVSMDGPPLIAQSSKQAELEQQLKEANEKIKFLQGKIVDMSSLQKKRRDSASSEAQGSVKSGVPPAAAANARFTRGTAEFSKVELKDDYKMVQTDKLKGADGGEKKKGPWKVHEDVKSKLSGVLESFNTLKDQVSRYGLETVFDLVDEDGSGDLSIAELSAWLAASSGQSANEAGLREIFQLLDKDRDGKVTIEEFQEAMKKQEQDLTVVDMVRLEELLRSANFLSTFCNFVKQKCDSEKGDKFSSTEYLKGMEPERLEATVKESVPALSRALQTYIDSLRAAEKTPVLAFETSEKFLSSEEKDYYGAYGDISSFAAGLEDLGLPAVDLEEAIEQEFCNRGDSMTDFRISNFDGSTTHPALEYEYVVNPDMNKMYPGNRKPQKLDLFLYAVSAIDGANDYDDLSALSDGDKEAVNIILLKSAAAQVDVPALVNAKKEQMDEDGLEVEVTNGDVEAFRKVLGNALRDPQCTMAKVQFRTASFLDEFELEQLMLQERQRLRRAMLTKAEVLSLRLYSGPVFRKMNAVLKNASGNFPGKYSEDLEGNTYTSSIFALSSGLKKLAQISSIPPTRKVYRGMAGGRLPEQFWKANEFGAKAGVEWSFLSTSKKREVAVQYIPKGKGLPTVLEFEVGMIDKGAPIDFLSQYPGEEEILFPPRSCIEVIGEQRLEVTPVGEVIVVPARINCNQKTLTIEEMVAKRKDLHLQLLKNSIDEVHRDLGALVNSEEFNIRTKQDLSALQSHAQYYLLREIHMECLECLDRDGVKEPEWYNDDDNFKSIVSQGAELKGMAINKFLAWLRNDEVLAANVIYDRFREIKRTRLSKLQKDFMRAKVTDDEGKTAQLALKLCKEKGIISKSLQETNELQETPLVAAANEGNVAALELLIAAKADINSTGDERSQTAVEAAVAAGETKCLHALLRAGAHISEAVINLACDRGHLDCLQELLLKIPFDPQAEGAEKLMGGRLGAAAEAGHADCLDLLFNSGAEIPAGKAEGQLVLKACMGGSEECAKILLEKGADVNGQDPEDGTSAIMIASMLGREGLVKLLLDHKANTEVRTTDASEATPLAFAALKGHDGVVKALLEAGAKPDYKDPRDGSTLLFSVAETGNSEILKLLIGAGADVNEKTDEGHTPLMGAAHGSYSYAFYRPEGRLECVKALLQAGADPNASIVSDNDEVPAWMFCIRQNDADATEECIKHNADLSSVATTQAGVDIMCLAATYGNEKMINLLLKAGLPADEPLETLNGMRPVMMAALLQQSSVVKLLLEQDVSVDKETKEGLRLLNCAVRSGNPEILASVLSKNPDLEGEYEVQEGLRITALVEAIWLVMQGKGKPDIVKTLLDKGANQEYKVEGMDGQTPLMIAAMAGLNNIVQMLLENAVQVQAVDKNGKTALVLAEEKGQFKCAEMLRAYSGY